MAVVDAAPKRKRWLTQMMTTDFCPWANRFVYWLKEPVGWFCLATAFSVLIGLYFSPIGWTLATSLTAIMMIGMVWPWVAVRSTRCGLYPEKDAVHEDTSCRMVLRVRNRIPIPVWGLTIDGFVDCHVADETKPTVGLACCPALCTADYLVNVTPTLRGHYPVVQPQVTCSFPFGIWTARRSLNEFRPLTVWPKIYPVHGAFPIVAQTNAQDGDGSRGGTSGDFVGVRPFRRGDATKHINWIASARSDSLIVTERGGPQSVKLDVWIDVEPYRSNNGSSPSGTEECEYYRRSLSRRIRVAASILASLIQLRVETRVRLGDRSLDYSLDTRGRSVMLNAMANIPLDGEPCRQVETVNSKARLSLSGRLDGSVVIRIENPNGGRRACGASRIITISPNDDIAEVVASIWTEVHDANVAA